MLFKIVEHINNSYLKSLSCASAIMHFSGPIAVGLLTSAGDITVLAIHDCVFMLGSIILEL